MQSETAMSQKIGLAVFWVGAVYMFVVGFLSSWWFVPAIREVGFNNLSVSGGVSLFWGISAPLGAMLAAIGAGLYARAGRRVTIVLVLGSVGVIALAAMWPVRTVVPALFGIDGGLITLFFLGLVWNWARSRGSLAGSQQLGSDLTMAGHVFFLFAMWFLCGLLGAPVFTLRPELLEEYGTLSSAANMGSLVSVFLVLGWGFTYFGHRTSLRARAVGA
jgi:hypothetical protein